MFFFFSIFAADLIPVYTVFFFIVDPQTYKVHIIDDQDPSKKEHITCDPASVIPMAQRFFIF